MTAALDLAGLSPEVLEALTAHIVAKLSVVPPLFEAPDGLSMLPASVRRRECERRQADAVRGDRSGDLSQGLSTIPATVRKREWKRRQAAAQKARSIPDRSPPLDLQPVDTEKKNSRRSPSDRSQSGPLASDLAQVVDRVSGYAESNRKRDRAWLYREAARIWTEDLGLALPSQWTGAKDWGACRALVRDWDRDTLLKAVLEGGRAWKQAPGNWSRPTLGLVLHRLRLAGPAAAAPTSAPKPDSRRLTGEQLEVRDLERARRSSSPPAPPRLDLSPGVNGELQRASGGDHVVLQEPVLVPAPASPPKGPLQLAEPSPATSAEARAVLDLVNATAARCRAFRGRS